MIINKSSNYEGFTLIELLVVISIISLLSSVVMVNVRSARIKAIDSKYVQELGQLRNAIALYKLQNGVAPLEGQATYLGNPVSGLIITDANFTGGSYVSIDTILAPLVSGNFISKIPHYIGWPFSTNVPNVMYYKYDINHYNYPASPSSVITHCPAIINSGNVDYLPAPKPINAGSIHVNVPSDGYNHNLSLSRSSTCYIKSDGVTANCYPTYQYCVPID